MAMTSITSAMRLLAGLVLMALCAAVFVPLLLLMLPWRMLRVRFGQLTGRKIALLFVWMLGCRPTLEGREHLEAKRPSILVSNHTSLVDIFLVAAMAPKYTVSIAKRQILYYPFFGLLYALSGHLTIDRTRTDAAKARMLQLAEFVKKESLSIVMWPEGSRARDGRLRPFKRGFVHLALQTGLPVVPFIIHGAHKSWKKGTIQIRAHSVRVEVLAAIDTSDWSLDRIDEAVEQVHAKFRAALPADQLAAALGDP